MMEVIVLGSSSKGNCIAVRDEDGTVLIDAGLQATKIVPALEDAGIDLKNIHGILISHVHGDHVQGIKKLSRATPTGLFLMTPLTAEALQKQNRMPTNWATMRLGGPFYVGGRMECTAFPVEHDAPDAHGFRIQTHTGESVSIATDMGSWDKQDVKHMYNADVILIETNHDLDMLKNAERPESLKDRIRGPKGHLSNEDAEELLSRCIGPNTKAVFGVHMSGDCNTPELAQFHLETAIRAAGMEEQIELHIVTGNQVERVIINGE